jgi:hypothetical protein
MSETCEKLRKRPIVLADGRYLIFFTLAPAEAAASSPTELVKGEPEGEGTVKET